MSLQCADYRAGRCRSCSLIEQPYAAQLAAKQAACLAALPMIAPALWQPPVASKQAGFRNKAKMAVGGTLQAPMLGLVDAAGHAVDLADCPLYPPALRQAFDPLRHFITQAGLVPYDTTQREGELKFILLTLAEHSGELMLRWVLRSPRLLPALQTHVPALLAALPQLALVSCNLQPVHQAILEGEEEIVLHGTSLAVQLNGMTLHLRPRSFFQTNTDVAAALYRTARDWVAALAVRSAWDLFCGVGGFALHLAPVVQGEVVGIEISAEAIAAAEQTAAELHLPQVRFQALPADAFALGKTRAAELVVVNPPRRGLGAELCAWLNASSARLVLYSSCNVHTLAQDLARMPCFAPQRAQLFDMFPHTTHGEVMVLLARLS